MDVLLIGAGGREHALAWKLAASPLLDKLYCAPGNPGIAEHAEIVTLDLTDHGSVTAFCKERDIGLVVVGPETPLVAGIADDLKRESIKVFGPSKIAARLEGSKGFTKDICARHGIPTAAYGSFDSRDAALAHVDRQGAPIVVKADGLAAGKGVTVAMTMEEARQAVNAIFEGQFGQASCVIEEFLEGEEASFFVLCDGTTALPFGTVQDHKRVGEGDTGPNTGGMGAYSPAPILTEALQKQVLREIVAPTLRALSDMGAPYVGILYAGLILTKEGPKLIEYNVRFGDPECQVLMPRLKDDLLTLMLAAIDGTLDKVSARWSPDSALTVVMCAEGYPGDVVKGSEIRRLDAVMAMKDVEVFHAGTALRDGKLIANGGRVLNITGFGPGLEDARARAYEAVEAVDWPRGFCRRDIGWRALKRDGGST